MSERDTRGLLALLTPEQVEAALAYDGPINSGPEVRCLPEPHIPRHVLEADNARLEAEARGLVEALVKALSQLQQAQAVCGEAYQVLGVMLLTSEPPHPKATKLLDNLAACRLVHGDVLPFDAEGATDE